MEYPINRTPIWACAAFLLATIVIASDCPSESEKAAVSTPGAGADQPTSVSAKHILVQYQGSMRADEDITRTKEEALARIKECLKKSAEGQKFEDLASEYSDGPSAPNGGDLGEFGKGMMDSAFEEASFACEVGKVTDVVETPFGYHIIYRYK